MKQIKLGKLRLRLWARSSMWSWVRGRNWWVLDLGRITIAWN